MSRDWKAPSATGRGRAFMRQKAQQRETLGTRLLAVLIAVPLFEGSLWLVLSAMRGLWHGHGYALHFWTRVPVVFHAVYLMLALAVAALFGMSGITWLLGHLFLTHPDEHKDGRITVGLWLVLVLLAVVGQAL